MLSKTALHHDFIFIGFQMKKLQSELESLRSSVATDRVIQAELKEYQSSAEQEKEELKVQCGQQEAQLAQLQVGVV